MSYLHKFLFEGLPVRGAIVRLDDAWAEIVRRRAANTDTGAWPQAVTSLLGQMSAAAALMPSATQFEGSLVLQIMGESGPLKLAVAQLQCPQLALRSTATLRSGAVVGDAAGLADLVGTHGRCAITLEPRARGAQQTPWQGIVPLVDAQGRTVPNIAQALELYMRQSEQLDTTLVLAANEQVAAGLLVQRMPLKGQANLSGATESAHDAQDALGANEDFNRIATLAASLSADELLSLDASTILRRLFWQEQLRMLNADHDAPVPHFSCSCSAERVRNMLLGLGRDEVQATLQEQQRIEVGCEYCGAQYRFDAVDVEQLFTATDKIQPHTTQNSAMRH